MGTTLTGTTPQDTYDSLIKVTDNGPLSGTAKYLSDGLGNDSVLALSTSRIGIGSTIDSGELITAYGAAEAAIVFQNTNSGTGASQGLYLGTLNAENFLWTYENQPLIIATNNAERMRILADGNVGIGTSTPAQKLDVAGRVNAAGTDYHSFSVDQGSAQIRIERTGTSTGVNYIGSDNRGLVILNSAFSTLAIFTANGLTFNGDTAAANALDDYEEGTWTPSLGGNTTYSAQGGTYTKIGRQVTAHFVVGVTTLGTGSAANITGLPFTSFSSNRGAGGVAFVQAPSTGYASINPFTLTGSTTVAFATSTILGVWADQSNVFTDGTTISGTVTYFV